MTEYFPPQALTVADIPALPTSKTTSGTFDPARIPSLVASGVPTWQKVATKTYADLSAAALTNDIEVYSLLTKQAIHGACLRVTTGFGGGLIAAYGLSLGITGNLIRYVAAASALSPVVTQQVSGLMPVVESFSAATSVRLSAVSTVGLLNAATVGTVEVYLCLATLP